MPDKWIHILNDFSFYLFFMFKNRIAGVGIERGRSKYAGKGSFGRLGEWISLSYQEPDSTGIIRQDTRARAEDVSDAPIVFLSYGASFLCGDDPR